LSQLLIHEPNRSQIIQYRVDPFTHIHVVQKLPRLAISFSIILLIRYRFYPLQPARRTDAFTFISQKYLRGSQIITSNPAFADWTEVFGDARLTSALLDRLTHHCYILEFTGESYRFRQSLQRQSLASAEMST